MEDFLILEQDPSLQTWGGIVFEGNFEEDLPNKITYKIRPKSSDPTDARVLVSWHTKQHYFSDKSDLGPSPQEGSKLEVIFCVKNTNLKILVSCKFYNLAGHPTWPVFWPFWESL